MENNNLPNFLIVGAAKAGTTSISKYLSNHKDIFVPIPKEPYFLTGYKFQGINTRCGSYGKGTIKNFEDYIE